MLQMKIVIFLQKIWHYIQKKINPNIKVKLEINNEMGYAPETKLRLSTNKLCALGWKPKYSICQILDNLKKSILLED